MGRLRRAADRLSRISAALGLSHSADNDSKAPTVRAAPNPVIVRLNELLLDGDPAAFQSAWDEAVTSAAEDAPAASQLLIVRAEADLACGAHERVRASAHTLLAEHKNAIGHYLMARSQFLLGQYPACIATLQQCLHAMPNHVDAAYLMSDAAVLAGDRELAWRSLEQLARKSKRARTWLLMANLVQTPGDYFRLHDNWRQARSASLVSANDVTISEYLALGALRCGNYALARQIWRTALLGVASNPGKIRGGKAKTVNYSGRRAETALADLNRVLKQAGIVMFLVSGTLLGCIREGRLLGHDKDIDVGVWDDVPAEQLLTALRTSGLFILLSSRSPEIVRLRHANGIAIDVFYHYRERDDYWHGGVKMRWHNKPFELVSHEFLGGQYLIPEDYETYLTENYGDWTEPKIAFDSAFDTPNGETSNPDELAIHSFKMLTDHLVKGEPDKVAFYLDKLEATGEETFVQDFRSFNN